VYHCTFAIKFSLHHAEGSLSLDDVLFILIKLMMLHKYVAVKFRSKKK